MVEAENNPAEEEGDKNPAEEEEDKNPAGEEDNKSAEKEVMNLAGQVAKEINSEAKSQNDFISQMASESSFSAGGRIISDHRTRLKSNTVEGLLYLQDWLNADDPKPTNKDVEEEEYLVFHQASKCPKERRARSRSSVPSSSSLSSPASSCSMSPSTS